MYKNRRVAKCKNCPIESVGATIICEGMPATGRHTAVRFAALCSTPAGGSAPTSEGRRYSHSKGCVAFILQYAHFSQKWGKALTFFRFMIKYPRYVNAMRKPRSGNPPKREGNGASPLCKPSSSHFQAARDDRDGNSRYRVTKMPLWR